MEAFSQPSKDFLTRKETSALIDIKIRGLHTLVFGQHGLTHRRRSRKKVSRRRCRKKICFARKIAEEEKCSNADKVFISSWYGKTYDSTKSKYGDLLHIELEHLDCLAYILTQVVFLTVQQQSRLIILKILCVFRLVASVLIC